MASKLKVWWIPQVPGKAFEVPVATVQEGVKIMDVLADYDLFQFRNNIKGDYANTGGLSIFNEEDKEWENWYYEDAEGNYFDEPKEYLEWLQEAERLKKVSGCP